jgi:hypothetical protein
VDNTENDPEKSTGNKVKKRAKKETHPHYVIASYFMNFIIERNLIALTNEINNSVEEVHRYKRKGEKSSSFTKMKSLYMECLFDLSILPMKMNLPMICPPGLYETKKDTEMEEFRRSLL